MKYRDYWNNLLEIDDNETYLIYLNPFFENIKGKAIKKKYKQKEILTKFGQKCEVAVMCTKDQIDDWNDELTEDQLNNGWSGSPV